MTSGLQRRLMLLLLVPLFVLTGLNTWFDYRLAESATLQQDHRLLKLLPLLADSIVSKGVLDSDPPAMLIAPPVEEFLSERPGASAFAVLNLDGNVVVGDSWLAMPLPGTREADFSSDEYAGITFRIASLRVNTVAGELVVRIADGSDPRQQWFQLVWVKVVLPNLALIVAAFFAVNWAVGRALKPLLDLKMAVEQRSPQDLSPLESDVAPDEVKPLVQSINRLLGLVQAQAQSQSRFVADAAHQLRTPLAALQAQVEAWAQAVNRSGQADWRDRAAGLKEQTTTAQATPASITLTSEQVNKLRNAARRTTQLANQLLALSRADARTAQSLPMQRIDLRQLCEVILENHLDAAAQKGIDLGLETVAAHATGHEWLLRELLSNLVDNAIKYTPAGGRVTLRCGWEKDGADGVPQSFLEVDDNGPGIAPQDRARVLDRFYRVPGVQTEGNGLGLAIAHEIALAHKSKLELQIGRGGCGLRVSLRLGP